MFGKRAEKKPGERKARNRRSRPVLEDLEARTVLSTLQPHAPAVEALARGHAEMARAEAGFELGSLRRGHFAHVTIGGTVSLPVTAAGNLTIQSFSSNNNQLTANGTINVNGTAIPVAFNVNVSQQGTNAPVMTLTPTTTSLNVAGLGNVALNTQSPITVSAGSGLSTLLGQVATNLGGVTDLNGIATGLNTGLNSSNNVLTNFALNGALNTTVGVQRFVNQNGQLAAQVTVNGNTQVTLPISTSAAANGNLALSTGTTAGGTINLGTTGVQLQSGQSISLPINASGGLARQVSNLIGKLETIAANNPRLQQNFTSALNRLVSPFTGQSGQSTSLIGGTVSLPVTAAGNLTIQSFSSNNNQLTANGTINVNGTAIPVAFNVNVSQQGTNAPVMTLTPTTTSLNVAGLGNVALNTQSPITVSAGSGLSTLLGQVATNLGGVTDLNGIATGLNTGLNSSNNVLTNFALNGTLNTTISVQRFVNQNGQLAAQVTVNGNAQATIPVGITAQNGNLTLNTGTGSAIALGSTGVQLQPGQVIGVPINGIPGPGNLVVNLLNQLDRQPRRLSRIVLQLNQRLALGAGLFG